jgi:tetratricopeptide (TPR) repeat protein
MRRLPLHVLVGCAAAVAAVAGGLFGGVLVEPSTGSAPSPASRALAERALGGVAGGVGSSTLLELEARARSRPNDATLLVELGFAHQLRWRETADPVHLTRSEQALRRALRARPGDGHAVLGLGHVALIRHRFAEALVLGRRAERLLPWSSRPYGVIGDAAVELGRYREGFAAFERMVSLRPGVASYARIAYARELMGNTRGAVDAMRLALDAAAGQPEPSAWALVELAKLERGPGRVERAERLLRGALRLVPGYVPARMELVRVELAKDRLGRALAEAQLAAEATPTPHTFDLLAELLDRAGRPAAAARRRAAGGPLDRALVANGMRIGLELAVHHADFGVKPAETVAVARRARAESPSIHGDDAVGWALARAGRCREALPFARRALRLGTESPLLLFHLGYAEGCAGNRATMRTSYARALALDPEFSVRWAPVARDALRG